MKYNPIKISRIYVHLSSSSSQWWFYEFYFINERCVKKNHWSKHIQKKIKKRLQNCMCKPLINILNTKEMIYNKIIFCDFILLLKSTKCILLLKDWICNPSCFISMNNIYSLLTCWEIYFDILNLFSRKPISFFLHIGFIYSSENLDYCKPSIGVIFFYKRVWKPFSESLFFLEIWLTGSESSENYFEISNWFSGGFQGET